MIFNQCQNGIFVWCSLDHKILIIHYVLECTTMLVRHTKFYCFVLENGKSDAIVFSFVLLCAYRNATHICQHLYLSFSQKCCLLLVSKKHIGRGTPKISRIKWFIPNANVTTNIKCCCCCCCYSLVLATLYSQHLYIYPNDRQHQREKKNHTNVNNFHLKWHEWDVMARKYCGFFFAEFFSFSLSFRISFSITDHWS